MGPEDLIIAGVSGGMDSIFLLTQLLEIGQPVIAVCFNHNLRPEAEEEIHFVNDFCKKIFIVDIVSNNNPDIIILTETFLLDEANLFIKNYKTYKTRNIVKRKGVAILLHKNLIISEVKLNNDINGRYIKLSIKTPGFNETYTISGLYSEPKGDKSNIPKDIFESEIIAGDLNDLDSGLKNTEYTTIRT